MFVTPWVFLDMHCTSPGYDCFLLITLKMWSGHSLCGRTAKFAWAIHWVSGYWFSYFTPLGEAACAENFLVIWPGLNGSQWCYPKAACGDMMWHLCYWPNCRRSAVDCPLDNRTFLEVCACVAVWHNTDTVYLLTMEGRLSLLKKWGNKTLMQENPAQS